MSGGRARMVRLSPETEARLPGPVRSFIEDALRRDCWISSSEVYRIDLGNRWWIVHRYRGEQPRINWVGRLHHVAYRMVRHMQYMRALLLTRYQRIAIFVVRHPSFLKWIIRPRNYLPWPAERPARRMPLPIRRYGWRAG
jgi:hypothetical protein